MKIRTAIILLLSGILIVNYSCRRDQVKNTEETPVPNPSILPEGLILIGQDIITDVIVKPDTLGDPWEVEKVKGFDGKIMFRTLFDRIYKGELTVYDCLVDEPLESGEIKKIENDFKSDMSRIAKIQFLEDWYFDPATNLITKRTKSISFGYERVRGEGLPNGYVALFRVKVL